MAPTDSKPGKTQARKGKPLTANPLFPAVVALWFGALFGLGSLAIRVGLLEQLVLASRIDTLFAAAAPPLGVTARIMLALVLTVLGAVLGSWIARKIAAPKPVVRERKRGAAPAKEDNSVVFRTRDSHPDAPARRPISAHEELGGSDPVGVHADAGALAGRRRSTLAITHDETFELHESAPLPGGAWQINTPEPVGEDETLDLGDFADGSSDDPLIGHFDPPPAAPGPALDWQAGSTATTDRQMFQPLPSAAADAGPEATKTPDVPLDFAPPSDAREGRQVFGMAQPQPDEVLDQLGITDAEFEELTPELPTELTFGQAVAAPVAQAPTEPAPTDNAKLGMDELAAKLASSMQLRRERAAAKAAEAAVAAQAAAVELASAPAPEPIVDTPVAAAPAVPSAYEPPVTDAFAPPAFSAPVDPLAGFLHPNDVPAPLLSEPLPAAAAPTSESVMSTRLPAALRPIAYGAELDDDADEAIASLLPPRSFVVPPPVGPAPLAAEPVDDAADEAQSDESPFSSLLSIAQPPAPRQDFVRIEQHGDESLEIEPVVIFPGQAARLSAVAAPAAPASASKEPASFRRFDSPESAEAGQQISASVAAPQDAAETERALRAALANLQRMSGAA